MGGGVGIGREEITAGHPFLLHFFNENHEPGKSDINKVHV